MSKPKRFLLAFAGAIAATPLWGLESTITKITRVGTTNAGDSIVIQAEPPPQSACTSSVKVVMKKVSTALFAESMSILLSAFHTDAKVRLYTDGCVDGHIAFSAVSVVK